MIAYSSSLAGTNVVWKTSHIVWITHENSHLHSRERAARQLPARASANSVVHDLTALGVQVSSLHPNFNRLHFTYLRISHQDYLSSWTFGVVFSNRFHHCCCTLTFGIAVADTTTAGLSSAGWIDDRFGARSREGGLDLGYQTTCSSITLRCSGLASTECVHFWTALSLLNCSWWSSGYANEEQRDGCSDLHDD